MAKHAVRSAEPRSPETRAEGPQVRDLMTPNPYTLGPRDTLASLYDLMDTHRIRHVPIVDQDEELVGLLRDAAATLFENKIGCLPVVEGSRLVGILTESDFVRRFVEEETTIW